MSSHMPNLRVIPQRFFNAAVLRAPRRLRGVIQHPCPRKPPLFIFLQLPYTLGRCTTHASHSTEQQRPLTATPLEVVLTGSRSPGGSLPRFWWAHRSKLVGNIQRWPRRCSIGSSGQQGVQQVPVSRPTTISWMGKLTSKLSKMAGSADMTRF